MKKYLWHCFSKQGVISIANSSTSLFCDCHIFKVLKKQSLNLSRVLNFFVVVVFLLTRIQRDYSVSHLALLFCLAPLKLVPSGVLFVLRDRISLHCTMLVRAWKRETSSMCSIKIYRKSALNCLKTFQSTLCSRNTPKS